MPRDDGVTLPLRLPPPRSAGGEWLGGRTIPPFWVMEGGPYRPEITIWIELPGPLVVAMDVADPRTAPTPFAETLRAAMLSPLAGQPRRPERVRVADPALAAELRATFGDEFAVAVAQTPELDAVLADMAASFSEDDQPRSYLEDGTIAPAVVAKLFQAAEFLWTVAPWRHADDDHVLRVDVPQLGIAGACLSVIGALGESLGLVLFPSFEAYQVFAQADDPAARADFGTSFLGLAFERGADLPIAMRREVARYGWPVGGPDAYPVVTHHERDGVSRPLDERDLRLATACARAVASFFARHGEELRRQPVRPVSESYSDEDDLTVRLTVPYEAFSCFEEQPARPPGPKVARNAPCPCGSGRKYKKCHLPADEAAAAQRPAAVHEVDERLVLAMWRWGLERFPEELWDAGRDFVDPEASWQLFVPWTVYHVAVRGRPLVDWYVERRGRSLSGAERAWLGAQREAWLGIWEVVEVEPGTGMTLHDLLSGARRAVREVSGTRTVVKRDTLLARIVTHDGVSVLCGAHPRPLPPAEAAELLGRARRRLRRRGPVPVDRLHDEAFGRYLIRRWEEAVLDMDARGAIPPVLSNTDGDPLLLTVDRFELAPGTERTVEERLAAIEGALPREAHDAERCVGFVKPGNAMHRSWENTSIGTAWFTARELRLETNSTRRADALRARVEAACGDLVRHRDREETDPRALWRSGVSPAPQPPVESPEASALLREMKARHYTDWVDAALPALDGQTPREAMRTREGRARVDVLLKDIENRESRLPQAERADLAGVRGELGLGE